MVGDSVAGVLAGFAHGRRVRSVGDPERAAPVSAQEVLDPFHGHVVPENGPKEGQFTSAELRTELRCLRDGTVVLHEFQRAIARTPSMPPADRVSSGPYPPFWLLAFHPAGQCGKTGRAHPHEVFGFGCPPRSGDVSNERKGWSAVSFGSGPRNSEKPKPRRVFVGGALVFLARGTAVCPQRVPVNSRASACRGWHYPSQWTKRQSRGMPRPRTSRKLRRYGRDTRSEFPLNTGQLRPSLRKLGDPGCSGPSWHW